MLGSIFLRKTVQNATLNCCFLKLEIIKSLNWHLCILIRHSYGKWHHIWKKKRAGLKVLFLVRIQLCWHIVSILWHGTNVSPWRWVIGIWVVSSSIFILFQNLTIKFSVLLGIYIYLNYQDFSRKISAIEFFPINTSVTSIFFTKSRGIAGRRFFSLTWIFNLWSPILWWEQNSDTEIFGRMNILVWRLVTNSDFLTNILENWCMKISSGVKT